MISHEKRQGSIHLFVWNSAKVSLIVFAMKSINPLFEIIGFAQQELRSYLGTSG